MTRKYGTGACYQNGNRWIGRLPDGRGGHRYFTGPDQADVVRRMDEARRSRDRTTSSSPRGGERLSALMDRYLTTVAPHRNRPRTLELHRQEAEHHILPVIGSIRVAQLDAKDVQRVVDRMVARGYSPKTIQNVVNTLSAVLRHAMREEAVTRNVAGLAVLPRIVRPKLPSLTTDQVHAFLEATRGEPLWPVWVLAATMGLRVSEVLGLLWRDVGKEEAPTPGGVGAGNGDPLPIGPTGETAGAARTRYTTITISGQYRRSRDADGNIRHSREEPKTEQSKATLYLPELAREALAVAKAQGTSVKLVFPGRGGNPRDRRYVGRAFERALERHGLPAVRLHSLRHSFVVSILDETGGDLRAAQAVARHTSVTTTVDRYGREADEARRRAADATDRAMAKRRMA
jgi:integrase